ncbi:MAG TPA: tRNA epoxyqueuosine(34) reductase QueG [Elusimicrobiota bacterium]|nr:tRNA epoxyqueuosine(34) reductase QueG [Elusimicrobiota bacterium]
MVSESERVKELARELGFDFVGWTTAAPVASDGAFLDSWLRRGFAADMEWMRRRPEGRARPQSLLPNARTVIVLGVGYYQTEPSPRPAFPAGRVARYAWGRDYHDVIGRRLKDFEMGLRKFFGSTVAFRSVVDAQPLLERAFARRAGLGFSGKNTNVLFPRAGSWFFLSAVLLEAELPVPKTTPLTGCGACVRCLERCPTAALPEAYGLDARRCISYLTIENRGAIAPEWRPLLGDRIFGCDTCQEVCPFNARPSETKWPGLASPGGVGAWLSLKEVLSMRTEDLFRARFAGTALFRAKRAGLLRNACVAAGNVASEELAAELEECLRHDDSPLVRGHAAWALSRAPKKKSRAALERALDAEPDAAVQEELRRALEPIPVP